MASRLADAHIELQRRLRALAARGVTNAWRRLPGYNDRDVDQFLSLVLPLMDAAQRQSILLTDAYLARALGRRPVGVDAARVIASLRGGMSPAEVYRRPFVTVWTALSNDVALDQAIAAGLARATSTAAMDVQLAHRGGMQAAQDADPRIRGWRRAADAGACAFCSMIDGAFVKSADAMPLHNHCGCGLEPLEDFPAVSPLPDGVAVREHGELGPMLGDPSHDFTIL